jgi:acyl dehydratase|tara:strand:- start:97 stop:552 length:456 start_codon:yes stop_codon:yes gene_type:complete
MKTVDVNELENIKGQDLGHSDWMAIEQDRINQFADATGDHQWIHLDAEKAAKELPTKSTIAHGFLSLSLIVPLAAQVWSITGAKMMINYGLNKVRFINMVPVGSKVRLGVKISEVNKLDNGGTQVISEATLEIDGQDKPAYVAESIMVAFP